MRRGIFIATILVLALSACGKQEQQQAPPAAPAASAATVAPAPPPQALGDSCSKDCGGGNVISIQCAAGETPVCECGASPMASCRVPPGSP